MKKKKDKRKGFVPEGRRYVREQDIVTYNMVDNIGIDCSCIKYDRVSENTVVSTGQLSGTIDMAISIIDRTLQFLKTLKEENEK